MEKIITISIKSFSEEDKLSITIKTTNVRMRKEHESLGESFNLKDGGSQIGLQANVIAYTRNFC